MTDRLTLSVAEAAEALGVSDDLVYELTERGELPCLRVGRRKLIPRRAVEMLVELAIVDFVPNAKTLPPDGVRPG
ncbi:MAG: excisionase family DNA-binding protein [Acidimicrobiales bacterium]